MSICGSVKEEWKGRGVRVGWRVDDGGVGLEIFASQF